MSEQTIPLSREQVRAILAQRDILAFLQLDKATLSSHAKALLKAAAEYEQRVENVDLLGKAKDLHAQAERDRETAKRALDKAHEDVEALKESAQHEIDARMAEVDRAKRDNANRLTEWRREHDAAMVKLQDRENQAAQKEQSLTERERAAASADKALADREARVKADEDRLRHNNEQVNAVKLELNRKMEALNSALKEVGA